MEKEFIPYEQALALKELGFDEPCLGFYHNELPNEITFIKLVSTMLNKGLFDSHYCTAPLYQQSFRWFRVNHGKDSFIARCNSTKEYFFDISWRNKKGLLKDFQSEDFKTHEEAELECLKKLIEIVKNK